VMKFYTNEEWEIVRTGVSLPEMISDTAFKFASAFKNHDNYKSFKKDFNKEVKEIYNNNDDDTVICTEIVMLMAKLSQKHFA
jgi:hypothetical protein